MSTRAVLARKTSKGWHGVIHIYDSAPWDLGNALLMELFERKGDLDGLVRELVDEGEGGWESFVGRTRASDEEPPSYQPDTLDGEGWLDWFYLFDTDARTLEVFWGEAPDAAGESDERKYSLSFDGTGRSSPAVFEAPEEERHLDVEEDDAWSADDERAAAERRAVARHMVQWCEGAEQNLEQVRATVAHCLATAIRNEDWEPPKPRESEAEVQRKQQLGLPLDDAPTMEPIGVGARPLRQPFWFTDDNSRYWRVSLEDITLLYPCGGAFRQDIDPLGLAREDGYTATLYDWDDILADEPELARQLGFACAVAAHPDRELQTDEDGDVYAVETVVDSDEPGPGEVSISRIRAQGLEVEVGDEVLRPVPSTIAFHLVLDWLRLGQVPA